MTNRYHIPVVVTATDKMSRKDVAEYVESILSNLEETDDIYRAYVEGGGIDEGDAEALSDMLNNVDSDDFEQALRTIEEMSKDDDNDG